MNVRLVHALVATLLATGPKCAEAGLCGRFEDGGETCSWSGCNARGTWCDTIGLNECRYTKCEDGIGCTEDIHCKSSDCSGKKCCGRKGKSAGCTACNSDGDCASCSSEFHMVDNECIQKKKDGESCSGADDCTSDKCTGGKCCGSKGKSKGCTACDSAGNCATCDTGFVKSSGECFLCGRFEDGEETCSWSGCNTDQTWCDTIGLNECRYTKCKDGNQCTENIHCDSGSCKLGNCCNGAEGRSTGCIGCDADGDCNACSEDYVNSNGECVLPGSLPDGHACESVECECKDSWDYRGEIYSGCQHLPLLGPTKMCVAKTECTGSFPSDTPGLEWTTCEIGGQGEGVHRKAPECTSGSCRGQVCCGLKGKSAGCTACNSDGDCASCSSEFHMVDNECIRMKKDGESCSGADACTSDKCTGGKCCGSKGKSKGCTACDSAGNCATCDTGFVKSSDECFPRQTTSAPSTEVTGGTEPASTAESDDAGEEISDENSEATETGSGVNDDDAASPSKTPSAVSENEDADLLPKIESAGSESDDANAGESEDSADESNDTIDANASVLCSEGVCEKEKNAGKIVGIVIGVLIAVVIVAFFAFRRDKDHVSSSNPAATTKEVISFENPTYELGESSNEPTPAMYDNVGNDEHYGDGSDSGDNHDGLVSVRQGDEHVVQLIDSWDDFDGNGYLDVAGAEGDMPLYDAASATAGGSDGDDMQLYDAASATAGGSDGDGMPLYDAATATAVGSGDSFGNDGEFDDPAEHDDGGLANESDSSDISL